MVKVKEHWTEKSNADYVFRISADLIGQIENKLEACNISQKALADMLPASEGYVSQALKNPGNFGLKTIAKFARALGLKVGIVLYDDNDPKNTRGPIHPDIFKLCWERAGKPIDFFAMNVSRSMASADTSEASVSQAKDGYKFVFDAGGNRNLYLGVAADDLSGEATTVA